MSHSHSSPSRRQLLQRFFLSASATALASAVLPGCGYRLQGARAYTFSSIYIASSSANSLSNELQRAMQTSSNVVVMTQVGQLSAAQVVLDIVSEQREKVVVGVNSSGQVREFQLRLRLNFKLRTQAGKELLEDTELLQQRDISFNETTVLSKEAEEAALYRNMQTDIVQQVTRRLAAVRAL